MAKTQSFNSTWVKYIMLLAFLIGTAVSIVVWATSEHQAAKDFATEADSTLKTELKEQYVQQKDFARIEENLAAQKEDVAEIKQQLSEIDETLEKIYGILWGNRSRISNIQIPE